ncbi:DNA translocase FtsK [Helicobacter sp. T3_23-1059]
MKKIYIFFGWSAFFVILTIATIFGDMGLAGELGRGLAMLNLDVFGYLGYVYLLFFIYPAYAVYKDSTLGIKRVKVIFGILFISAGILVVQYSLFDKGKAGAILIKQIAPFVGIAGVVLATLLSFLVGILLLMPDKIFWLKEKLDAVFSFLRRCVAGVWKWILGVFGYAWEGISAFFASDVMRDFNKPLKEHPNTQEGTKNYAANVASQQCKEFRQNLAPNQMQEVGQQAAQRNVAHGVFASQDFARKEDLHQNNQNLFGLHSHSPHFQNKDVQKRDFFEPDFDELQVNITYTDKEKERETKEKKERKYAKMVRLVGEGEEGEILQINADDVLAQARARDKEMLIPTEPLNTTYTRLLNDTNPANAQNPSVQNPNTQNQSAQNLTNPNSIAPHLFSAIEGYQAIQGQQEQQEHPNNINNYAQESTTKEPTHESMQENFVLDSAELASTNNISQSISQNQQQNLSQNLPQNLPQSSLTNPSQNHTKDFHTFGKPTPSKTFEASDTLLKELEKGTLEKPKDYELPDTSYLAMPPQNTQNPEEDKIDKKIYDLEHKLKTFKINGSVERFYLGPVVTTFEFVPEASVKVSRIQSLSNDLALALSAHAIRIQAPIPGKGAVGIEVPNNHREIIYLREVLESELFKNAASPLALGLGKDLVGNPFVTDLKKLPHLLVAGTTGSGKSVGVNAMILSLLYRNSPQNLRLIMIDPKQVEFSMYEDIPHLLTPIITEAEKAIIALNNLTREMERRYKLMKESKTKTIDNYNAKAKQEGGEVFPFIVVIIDELADLMMTGGKNAEAPIIRIAQMGRASGLHLIVATQRPSVDVVTGLIKTNLPAKIAFKVGTRTDSRVILDNDGAQNLLGNGDMLFAPGGSGLLRLHAPWVSEKEIESIVEFICSQGVAEYDTSFLSEVDDALGAQSREIDETEDFGVEEALLQKAKEIMLRDGKTSISHLQTRGLGGYPKCKKIVFQLEKDGFLSAPDSKGTRYIIGA